MVVVLVSFVQDVNARHVAILRAADFRPHHLKCYHEANHTTRSSTRTRHSAAKCVVCGIMLCRLLCRGAFVCVPSFVLLLVNALDLGYPVLIMFSWQLLAASLICHVLVPVDNSSTR